MSVIVVANPKGGVGKSTLATNLAGHLARNGRGVVLGDLDQQRTAELWLSLRPQHLPPIGHWEIDLDNVGKPPKGADVVVDTPAGLNGAQVDAVLRMANKVIVPLQPSVFDIHATHAFLERLQAHRRSARVEIGLVEMRTKEGTIAVEQLRSFLGTIDLPVIGHLRDTQNYVHLAAHGLTVWDVAPSRVERDLEQWQPIAEWVAA